MTHFDRTAFRVAARARLLTVASYPGHAFLEYEGRKWQRPDASSDQLFVRELLRTREERNSSTGFIQAEGRFNFDVFSRRGAPLGPGETLAKEIAEAFAGSQSLAAVGFSIAIIRSERSEWRPAPSPDWSFLPVSFLWRVFTPVSAS